MFFTPNKDDNSTGQKTHIEENSGLPYLYRLKMDFGFVVITLNDAHKNKTYALCDTALTTNEKHLPECITPTFSSLNELEQYVAAHRVSIIQKYLFRDKITPFVTS